jgi:peptide chain release factor 3
MVLDSAKGIEPQTLKLFEVCRSRRTPIITFLNKQDRPGLEPFELVDDITKRLSLDLAPMMWPVGRAGELRGLLDCRSNSLIVTERTAHGSTMPAEHRLSEADAAEHAGEWWQQALDERDLLEATYGGWSSERFLAGELSPVFAGSALGNVGVRQLLDAIIDDAPPPSARQTADGVTRALTESFSGFVFKIQANLDPQHRDRMAFIRICSGRFERGETLVHATSGKPVTTKHAATVSANDRETVDEAFPGDIVALVNAKNLAIGDTLCEGRIVQFPRLPRFAPETFAVARPKDISKSKQFKTGVEQLDAEGVIQTLRDERSGPYPIVAVVGQLQLDVFAYRMANEYNAEVILETTAHSVARRTNTESAPTLLGLGGIRVVTRTDGALLALFENPYRLERLLRDSPELMLDPVVEQ